MALGPASTGLSDITILGIGMFLVCGRVGCFLVGCSHGDRIVGGSVTGMRMPLPASRPIMSGSASFPFKL